MKVNKSVSFDLEDVNKINSLIEAEYYKTFSDFIKDAVKEKLLQYTFD